VSNAARTEHACACAAGWIGAQCDIVDPCYPSCGHGTCVVPAAAAHALADPSASLVEGVGVDLLSAIGCVCEGEYWGQHCEYDPCRDVDCGQHGSCRAGSCVCTHGYSGYNCEVRQTFACLESFDLFSVPLNTENSDSLRLYSKTLNLRTSGLRVSEFENSLDK
jgi:hypothetical protein